MLTLPAAVLGALQSRFHQLQESARGMSIPDNLKHNISANLGNVREFVGDFVPGARGGTAAAAQSSDAADSGSSAPPGVAPSPEAIRGNGGANGDAHAAGHAAAVGHAAATSTAAGHSDSGGALALEATGGDASPQHRDGGEAAELDTDPDLEAYLNVRQ